MQRAGHRNYDFVPVCRISLIIVIITNMAPDIAIYGRLSEEAAELFGSVSEIYKGKNKLSEIV